MRGKRDEDEGAETERSTTAERSTAAILHRSEEAADRIEAMLRESELLLERLRSGR